MSIGQINHHHAGSLNKPPQNGWRLITVGRLGRSYCEADSGRCVCDLEGWQDHATFSLRFQPPSKDPRHKRDGRAPNNGPFAKCGPPTLSRMGLSIRAFGRVIYDSATQSKRPPKVFEFLMPRQIRPKAKINPRPNPKHSKYSTITQDYRLPFKWVKCWYMGMGQD